MLRFYVSNRAPFRPSRLIGLPIGSVKPAGWLCEMLERQRQGLTGHLCEISAWLQKQDNAWLRKEGKGEYGWEELAYWLKGYIELAYLFEDAKMIDESHIGIEGTLASQRANGDIGPDQRFHDGTRDYWANMVMLFCLQSYYERTSDPRVLELMTRYFKLQASACRTQRARIQVAAAAATAKDAVVPGPGSHQRIAIPHCRGSAALGLFGVTPTTGLRLWLIAAVASPLKPQVDCSTASAVGTRGT